MQNLEEKMQKCPENLQNFEKFCKKNRHFPKICKKSGFFSEKLGFFSNSAVSEVCLSERASKMLQNELLDVQKLDELAENEPLQTSKIRSSELTRQGVQIWACEPPRRKE